MAQALEAINSSMAVMERCLNSGDSSMRAIEIAEAHEPLINFIAQFQEPGKR